MYFSSLNIRLIVSDMHLQPVLESAPLFNSYVRSFVCVSEYAAADLSQADIVICDNELVDVRTVRAVCKKNVILIVCAEHTVSSASITENSNALVAVVDDSLEQYADEVWTKPLSYRYVESRFSFWLGLLQERKEHRFFEIMIETAMDTSPDLIWFKDTRGAHLKVNDAFCKAVGKTKQQVEGRGHYYIWDITPSEYADGEYVCLESEEIVLNKLQLCLFEERVKCKQGMRQFSTYKAPLVDDDGTVKGTVGIAQDVTKLEQVTHLLAQSEATLNTISWRSHFYYWKYSVESFVAHLGAVYAADTGLPPVVENYAESIIALGLVHPDSVEICRQAHTQISQGKNDVSYELHMVFPDGLDRWQRITYMLLEDDSYTGRVLLGMSEDIDDDKRIK